MDVLYSSIRTVVQSSHLNVFWGGSLIQQNIDDNDDDDDSDDHDMYATDERRRLPTSGRRTETATVRNENKQKKMPRATNAEKIFLQ